MIPEKVSVTATLSVIRTGPHHMAAIASLKEVTCYVKAEQKLIGLPSLQGERGPMGPVGNAVWGGITGDINDQTDLGSMAQIDDAPSDGAEYVRKNGNWAVSSGGGGGGGASWGAITGTLSNQTDLQTALNAKADTADLGDLAYEDSVDYSDVTNTPTLGTMASVNDASSDDKTYGRKNGTWVEVTGGGGGSTDWGDIGGTLSNQTDLQTALDAKADKLDLAEEFDATKNYSEDDCVIYNNVLYVFNEYKAAGTWDANKVTQLATLPIVDRKLAWKANVYEIALPFETSQSYSAGDYVTYDDHLFLFLSDKAAGAWDWNKVRPTAVDVVMTQRLSAKQDTLTFDSTPTSGSTNPVESGGIKTALDAKQNTLTFDTTPTASSTNPATSGGIYTAIHGRTLHISMASTSSLGTISNAAITTTMRVVNIVWGTPSNVTSDVTWNTNTAGQLVLSGTLAGATTAEIDLIDFG